MTETVIPLYDLRDGQHHRATVPAVPNVLVPAEGRLTDTRGRRLHDLRVSVTDRCNFRCTYCMPEEGMQWLAREEILSFEEITRIARVFGKVGIKGDGDVLTDIHDRVDFQTIKGPAQLRGDHMRITFRHNDGLGYRIAVFIHPFNDNLKAQEIGVGQRLDDDIKQFVAA
nr:hypothetical protein [Ralstonia sp.]